MMELLDHAPRFPAASQSVAHRPDFYARAATPLCPVEAPTRRWRESLNLIERHMPFLRRSLHAGDGVQTAGDAFDCLHLVYFGAIKTMVLAADGYQQVAGLHLKGDWVGLDGIATGYSACDGYAMDTSEVWTVRYDELLRIGEHVPELVHVLHTAMGNQMARDREWRFAQARLPADARLADFLRSWAQALALRDMRTDDITLRLTRAEIGNYLGMRLETVSRSFSRLVEVGLLAFDDKRRRHVAIPDINALVAYVQSRIHP